MDVGRFLLGEIRNLHNYLIDFSDFLPTISEAANIEVSDSLDIDGQSFLKQLRGEKGHPRNGFIAGFPEMEWAAKLGFIARNHRYELYESGKFYEIPKDYEEQNPIDLENLDSGAKEVYQRKFKYHF